MRRVLLIAVIMFATLFPTIVRAEIFVAPDGRDENPGTREQPFATLSRARSAVRALDKSKGVTVTLRGGRYAMTEPIVLGPEDSGAAEGARIVYCSAPGETAVITGARRITGWTKLTTNTQSITPDASGHLWIANIPAGWKFASLYVDGHAQSRARWPDSDDWRHWPTIVAAGEPGPGGQLISFPPQSLNGVPGNGDAEMTFLPTYRWMNELCVLRDVDAKSGTARRHSKNVTYHGKAGDPFRIENVLSALHRPGQWCVDSQAGRVYFWPEGDRSPNDSTITAPLACNLVRIEGAHDIEFRDLTFECTNRLSEDVWPDQWVKRNFENPDAAIVMVDARDCAINNCSLTRLGAYAIAMQGASQRNRVVGCEMSHLGSGGVEIYGPGPGTREVCFENVVDRNHIHHIGEAYWHSPAISVFCASRNRITLNLVHDLPYCGISFAGVHSLYFNSEAEAGRDSFGHVGAQHHIRWDELPPGSLDRFHASKGTFTYAEVKPLNHVDGNVVEHNIVRDVMLVLHDGGSLYAFATGPGNIFRRNLIRNHPVEGMFFPLYMDDEVDDATVESNVVWSKGATIRKGANHWLNNIESDHRTPDYDRLLDEIMRATKPEGGWRGAMGDDSAIDPR